MCTSLSRTLTFYSYRKLWNSTKASQMYEDERFQFIPVFIIIFLEYFVFSWVREKYLRAIQIERY